MDVGIDNTPLSPALSNAGFRAIWCNSDDETECCWCSRSFTGLDLIYWSDDGLYGDAAEAHCRRCAFESALRTCPEPMFTFYARGWKKPRQYDRRTIKAYYRPHHQDRMYFHRAATGADYDNQA